MDIKENNIMLIGFMGSGKTTVSHELSRQMQIPEVDMDAYIVRHEGKSISDIFAESGEDVFREIETSEGDSEGHRADRIMRRRCGASG